MESCSPNVLARSRVLSHPSSVVPTRYWLVVMCKILNGGHLRPHRILFLYFCCCSICCPKQRNNTPHSLLPSGSSSPSSLPSPSLPPTIGDCYVLWPWPNSGHLRPRPRPSLYLLMHLKPASQPREPATTSTNLPLGTCNRLIGSCVAMIWGHGRCCHGDREIPLGVGQQQLILMVLYVMCYMLCCVCWIKSNGGKGKYDSFSMSRYLQTLDSESKKGIFLWQERYLFSFSFWRESS